MKIFLLVLVYFVQLFLVINHGNAFGKFTTPYLLFITTVLLPWLYFQVKLENRFEQTAAPVSWKWAGVLMGVGTMVVATMLFIPIVKDHPDPSIWSDVMPQLEALYHRYVQGKQPYYPVDMGTYSPYPVYMPLHWLPIGITDAFGLDARWIGVILLFPAMALVGQSLMKSNVGLVKQLVPILLVALPILVFFGFSTLGMAVSLETVIVAYYLVLVSGLIRRNLTMITIGIILIMLSRYTFIFWLPTLAYVLLNNIKFGKLALMVGMVLLSIVLLYYLPFLTKDPSIFMKGLNYHRLAVLGEWNGYGDPPISYSMEDGLSFAGNIKNAFKGQKEDLIFYNRALQASMLLLTMFVGLWGYHTKLKDLHFLDLSLGMLYVFVMIFFVFSPLTYSYYLMVPLVLAGVLVADAVTDS